MWRDVFLAWRLAGWVCGVEEWRRLPQACLTNEVVYCGGGVACMWEAYRAGFWKIGMGDFGVGDGVA